MTRSPPLPPPAGYSGAGPPVVWGFLGEEGTTQDGYRIRVIWGPTSRRYLARVFAPDGSEHTADGPSSVDAKRAGAALVDDLRRKVAGP